jgi:putative ABC transport system permease protein
VLARTLDLEVGDRITLTSPLSVQPSNTFTVRGIYTASRRSIDRSSFLFHWEYLNESLPESRKDEIGWMIARVGNAGQSAAIARRVDRIFENEDIQTLSMSEKALNLQFMAMFSAILGAMDIISIIILLILLMILGNTVAMGVRERTNEYGVLRALGFRPHHVAFFILGESVLVGILAGLLGIAFAFPVIELGMGRFLEENMGGMFPYFRIEPETYAAAIGFAALLGAVAAMIPALRASRLTIVDALRRTE